MIFGLVIGNYSFYFMTNLEIDNADLKRNPFLKSFKYCLANTLVTLAFFSSIWI